MRRFVAFALTAALMLSTFALAVVGQGYPEWDGVSEPDDAFCASFDGTNIALNFDPARDYSNVTSGFIQACFFAYDKTEEHYLELYLLLPEGVKSGDVFTSADGSGSSVSLFETAMADEDYYCADERGSDASRFEMKIGSAEVSTEGILVSGSLSASLVQYDEDDRPLRNSVNIEGAHFNFTLPQNGEPFSPTPTPETDGDAEQSPFALPTFPSQPRQGDRPSFTLPPDYAVI